MRKLIFLIIACLIVVFEVYGSNFQPLNSGTSNNLFSAWFIDANTGYVSGANGTIIKTTNAGLNWQALNSATSDHLWDIYFLNALTGYACSATGAFLKTTNAGVNWTVSYPSSVFLKDVYFINEQTGWLVGSYKTCLKTTNAGVNWFYQNMPVADGHFRSIVFNNGKGFIAVNNSTTNLLTTTNYGVNWVDSKIRTGWISSEDFCFKNNFGVIVGREGFENPYAIRPLIFTTTNNGLNWIENPLPLRKASLRAVSVCSGNICYACGEYLDDSIYNNKGAIFRSTNNGQTWLEEPWVDEVNLQDVKVTSSDVYIVGNGGLILKSPISVGIKPVGSQIPEQYNLSQNYPNPFNPITNINFSIPKTSAVKLTVYDLTGKEVEVLVNQNLSAGDYKVDFTANKLASGIYFYRLQAGNFIETKKMILVR